MLSISLVNEALLCETQKVCHNTAAHKNLHRVEIRWTFIVQF